MNNFPDFKSSITFSRSFEKGNIFSIHADITNKEFNCRVVIVIDIRDHSYNQYLEMGKNFDLLQTIIISSVIKRIVRDFKSGVIEKGFNN